MTAGPKKLAKDSWSLCLMIQEIFNQRYQQFTKSSPVRSCLGCLDYSAVPKYSPLFPVLPKHHNSAQHWQNTSTLHNTYKIPLLCSPVSSYILSSKIWLRVWLQNCNIKVVSSSSGSGETYWSFKAPARNFFEQEGSSSNSNKKKFVYPW